MKHLNKIWFYVTVLMLVTSCADDSLLDYSVDKPESVAAQETINKYGFLKDYVDREQNPNFKLGVGVTLSDYTDQGVMYRLVNNDFDEMTIGYGMKHGAIVQSDGSLDLSDVDDLLTLAKAAGITVYGHTLCWHSNQNADYLNSVIAPTTNTEPYWETVSENDFESDDASNYKSNGAAVFSFTNDGEGADGTGRALIATNEEARSNDWECQLFFTFPTATVVGEKYTLSMDIKSDAAASIGTQAQYSPGSYKYWNFFGSISTTSEWTTFEKEVTIDDNTSEATCIAFNLGTVATNYYFDNIKLTKYHESGGTSVVYDASLITDSDFNDGSVGGWGGWGSTSSRGISAAGEGYGGTGYAYTFTNTTAGNYWNSQIAYGLSTLENGETYTLNFKVKASAAGTIRAEIQSSSDYSSDSYGTFSVTTSWQEYTLDVTATADNRNRFVISFGDYVGTVYLDDITLCRKGTGGAELSDEEKKDTLTYELERWISGIMTECKDYVTAWDVVNEPMDDSNPYELKTSDGDDASDEFYWQDYLGKDYAVTAFKFAREYGNADDKLFINDYNLEYNLDKCKGLIQYVEYIDGKLEEEGVNVIDGIGTQMHITINSDTAKIAEMFTLLAETDKLIKISELDIGLGGVLTENATDSLYELQSNMYRYVVKKYFELIPAAQRYGITVWSPLDSPKSSSWRAGEPIGLWTTGHVRKQAYAGFANGLAGEDVSASFK
jgi:endo-1,4-beta-xylanase